MANINKIRLSGTTYNIEDENASKTVELTQAQYDALATKEPNTYYVITDATAADMTNYYTKAQTDTALATKQATLVSGTNIKTINNESILGSGNIDIQGGGATYTAGTNISIANDTINCTLPITADSYNNITIGNGSSSSNYENNVAIGNGATAGRNGWYGTAIAIGKSASAPRAISIAIGQLANADGGAGIAIGSQASTNITQGVAIGNQANATGTTKMNLNNQIKVDTNNQVYIKDKTNTTDVCIQDAIAALGGLKLVSLTQAQYDALSTKDASTIYFING